MSLFHPLSGLTAASRSPDHPVVFGEGPQTVLSWEDFCRGVAALGAHIAAHPRNRWILCTESTPDFLMGFLALLQSGKEVVLPANLQEGSVADAGGREAGILDEGTLAGVIAGRSAAAAASFVRVDPDRAVLHFHTSGSTGSARIVTKRLTQIENELANLYALWGSDLEGRRVRSSVSHQHIYGFLFSAMLPLCMGLAISARRISAPETLGSLPAEALVLVLSPAFLKRATQARTVPFPFNPPPIIFSSGGVLPGGTAEAAERIFGARTREIYGSTETGGIAYRDASGDAPWRCFPGVSVRIAGDSRIEVQSPYLPDNGYFLTGDAGRLISPGGFSLTGRIDSIVKIEEKRVALGEVENRLRESPLVEDAHVVALERSRQLLAAVVALSPAGRLRFAEANRRDITAHFRAHLLSWFEPTVLPRKWRYVEAIPRDAQGKVHREAVRALFDEKDEPVVTAVERDGSRIAVSLHVPADCVFFDGHFPSFQLLPGVVQVDWVMRFARRYLGITSDPEEIPRLKFARPILPGSPLRMEIQFEQEKSQILFRYLHGETGEVFSSGRLNLQRRS